MLTFVSRDLNFPYKLSVYLKKILLLYTSILFEL